MVTRQGRYIPIIIDGVVRTTNPLPLSVVNQFETLDVGFVAIKAQQNCIGLIALRMLDKVLYVVEEQAKVYPAIS